MTQNLIKTSGRKISILPLLNPILNYVRAQTLSTANNNEKNLNPTYFIIKFYEVP